MSINPQLLVRNDAADDDDAEEEEEVGELGERIFFVERLKDVAIKDLIKLGTPLEEWGPDNDRYEVRYLVKWLGYEDPAEDTWEPKRNLHDWQPSYDADLAEIISHKPRGFNLEALHQEAKRLSDADKKARELKAAKKEAATAAKKSTTQAGSQSSAKGSVKGSKGKKGKGEKKEKGKKKARISGGSAQADIASKSRNRRESTSNASPAPSSTSRAAPSLRRSVFGAEAMDQAALNDFIATNAPPSVRALRFSPPPKHDQYGNLIHSSDTEDSPTPEPAGQHVVVDESSAAATLGFAGDDDSDEEGDRVSTSHPSETKPAIPSAGLSAQKVEYGFAGDDDDEEDDYTAQRHLVAAHTMPAPASAAQSVPYVFAGSDDSDDEPAPPSAFGAPPHVAASAAAGPSHPPAPAQPETTTFGFAGDGDYDDDKEEEVAMPPSAAVAPPMAMSASAGPPASTRPGTASFGFAGEDDDDDDNLYFPHLASSSMPPIGQTADATLAAEPTGALSSTALKTEERLGFAGGSDGEGKDTGMPGPETLSAVGIDAVRGEVTTAADALTSGSIDKQPPPVPAETRSQVEAPASGARAPNVDPIRPPVADQARQRVATSQQPGVVDEAQRERTVGQAADTGPSVPAADTDIASTAPSTAAAMIERVSPVARASASPTAMSPPPVRKATAARPSQEKETARSHEVSQLASEAAVEGTDATAPAPPPRMSTSPADIRQSAAGRSDREASRGQGEDVVEHDRARPLKKRKHVADGPVDDVEDDGAANGLTRLKIRRRGDAHARETSPVNAGPSPGASGGSDSRGSASAVKAADPFNHGRVRTNVTNGYVQCNTEALRMKNLTQALTEGEKVYWPTDGPFSVLAGAGGVEEEKIKYLWSIGRYGDPLHGTDNFDDIMKPLTGDMDFWIAPPPDENKTRINKSAKAQLVEYYALQLMLSGYARLRQADSPRNSVKVVFVHVSKLAELGSPQGAFAQLEHLRCRGGTRFFAYGRGANMKRACFQFWRSSVAITFSPAALLRQAAHLDRLLPALSACIDQDTHMHNVFPWIPLQYVLPGGPLGRPASADDTVSAPSSGPEGARRAAVLQILPLLAARQLVLADFAPPEDSRPLLRPIFPASTDRVSYGGPQRAYFEVLRDLGANMKLGYLQKLICSWRSRYPLIRNWQIICTQEELATAQRSALPGIELVSVHDAEKRLLS
ncbi:hypothetical protein JCM3774_003046 [Rhodotorula dairenensis]